VEALHDLGKLILSERAQEEAAEAIAGWCSATPLRL